MNGLEERAKRHEEVSARAIACAEACRAAAEDSLPELGYVRIVAYVVPIGEVRPQRLATNTVGSLGLETAYYQWQPCTDHDCDIAIVDSPTRGFAIAFRARMSLREVRGNKNAEAVG